MEMLTCIIQLYLHQKLLQLSLKREQKNMLIIIFFLTHIPFHKALNAYNKDTDIVSKLFFIKWL